MRLAVGIEISEGRHNCSTKLETFTIIKLIGLQSKLSKTQGFVFELLQHYWIDCACR